MTILFATNYFVGHALVNRHFLTAYTSFFFLWQWIFKSSNLHFLNPSYKNPCSGIAFFEKCIVNGWTLNFCNSSWRLCFCLLSQIKKQIYNMLIEQIWPCSSVFSKPSPTTYHISSVLVYSTVNCQKTNLKTALPCPEKSFVFSYLQWSAPLPAQPPIFKIVPWERRIN